MLASAIPTKIQLPFAASGDKVTIPVLSQIGIVDGRASFTTGFVPLNGTPLSAGGVAPFETDFNGIFNQITAVQQWQCAGGIFKYDVDFSTAIGGYPKYCILMGTAGIEYLNLADNNTTDPDSLASANWGSRQGITPPIFDRTKKIATMEAVAQAAGNFRSCPAVTTPTVITGDFIGTRLVAGAAGSAYYLNMMTPGLFPSGSSVRIYNLSGFPLPVVQETPDVKFISSVDASGTATSYVIPNLTERTFTVYQTGGLWLVG